MIPNPSLCTSGAFYLHPARKCFLFSSLVEMNTILKMSAVFCCTCNNSIIITLSKSNTIHVVANSLQEKKKLDNKFHCLVTKFRMIIKTVASFFSKKVNKVSAMLGELWCSTLFLQLSQEPHHTY